MFGKILGAVAGKSVAKHVRGVDGPGGAILGVGAVTLLRRLGPGGMIAAAAGAYAWKKYQEKHKQSSASPGAAQRS